jgi:hypothetical protein
MFITTFFYALTRHLFYYIFLLILNKFFALFIVDAVEGCHAAERGITSRDSCQVHRGWWQPSGCQGTYSQHGMPHWLVQVRIKPLNQTDRHLKVEWN